MEIVGIVCVFWAVFMLGRLWERDHPKVEKLTFEDWKWESEIREPRLGVRPTPYDWERED